MSYIERMSAPALITAEELLRLNLPNKRTELVRGQLVVREPAGYVHGELAMRLGAAILQHAEAHSLGRVFAAETGFTLARGPDTVRAPDVAFITTHVCLLHRHEDSPSRRRILPSRFFRRMTVPVKCSRRLPIG